MRWPRYYEGPNKDQYIETGLKRYAGFDLEGRSFVLLHTTSDSYKYEVIAVDSDYKESDDVASVLEEAFHFIVDSTEKDKFDEVVYGLMSAIPLDELDESYVNTDEYVALDLGYVIPGLIDFYEILN